ncbi:16S rRNA (cytosine(967)-C(5))-methyltransferase RsmB [Halanaerobium hydrogeniformans]|uniref:16S rRNA (cytosine(967)-C(5))-methyltransferase n=1 Tax=Halanaerobium hydrogeniformans TaxID=656519 RepID=E4RLT8_HALHG|nr:16S rRNA (cytosine(967)-C(5))-methyltransferase RsmB [Halanaerobium hydrogeniformans]ADQ15002.1 sun protein [Halanaerobium hydrogeniformans]
MTNLRTKIIEALARVEKGSYSTLLLDSFLQEITDQRDKNLFTEIFYGVIRNKLYLDHIIKHFSNKSLEKMDKEVLLGLRIGIYQLLFLDKIPARAAIYESVEAVKLMLKNKGAAAFVNGILRNVNRKIDQVSIIPREKSPLKHFSIKYSYPEWMIKRFIDQYGIEKAEKIIKAGNKRAEVIYRHNSLKMSKQEFLRSLKREGLDFKETFVPGFYNLLNANNPVDTEVFKKGGAYIQGTSAGLASLLLEPKEDMDVLDLAAAPGGKTTHLAMLMENTGHIKALDINPTRLNLIKENMQRLGVKNVSLEKADAAEYQSEKKYDRILADLPCSGLGLISAKPEIKWQKKEKDIKNMAKLQYEILNNNISKLKSEGMLLYSTCTLTREENQLLIERILTENKSLELLDLNKKIKNITGLEIKSNGYVEILPGLINSEGFFYALLKNGA